MRLGKVFKIWNAGYEQGVKESEALYSAAWREADSKIAALRKAIEDAPHENNHDVPCYAGMVTFAKCNCWKAKALNLTS